MHTYFWTKEEWIIALYKQIPTKQSSLQADTKALPSVLLIYSHSLEYTSFSHNNRSVHM